MQISVLQLDTAWCDKQKNFSLIEQQIRQNLGSDVYVLPEMFATGFTNDVVNQGEDLSGETVSFMRTLAKKYNIAVCGSMILHEANCYYNSFMFVKPSGELQYYNKRHLFRFGGEAEMFTAGNERVIVQYLGVRILLQVCYDLRFPVSSRNNKDYDLALYVANWPASRRKAFDALLLARAIENQAYIIAVNRIGQDGNGLQYNGGTCCIDYKGDYLWQAENNKQQVGKIDINLDELQSFRTKFPFLDD